MSDTSTPAPEGTSTPHRSRQRDGGVHDTVSSQHQQAEDAGKIAGLQDKIAEQQAAYDDLRASIERSRVERSRAEQSRAEQSRADAASRSSASRSPPAPSSVGSQMPSSLPPVTHGHYEQKSVSDKHRSALSRKCPVTPVTIAPSHQNREEVRDAMVGLLSWLESNFGKEGNSISTLLHRSFNIKRAVSQCDLGILGSMQSVVVSGGPTIYTDLNEDERELDKILTHLASPIFQGDVSGLRECKRKPGLIAMLHAIWGTYVHSSVAVSKTDVGIQLMSLNSDS
eukprot:m.341216 g.341216  ORF g.341216 m.341216 type:complete len:283 (-) comp27837_c1_seq20:576-1424(-)